jgi:hypothetical protein
MRDAIALVSLTALLVAAGAGFVRVIGLPFRGPWLASSLGLAPVVGVLSCSLVVALGAVVGVPISIYVVGLTAAAFIALAWRRAPMPRSSLGSLAPREQSGGARAVEVVLLCVLAAFAFRLIGLLSVVPVSSWDGWAIWAARARALYAAGDVWSPAFQDPSYAPQHLEYPILFPTLEALSLNAIGRYDAAMLHVLPGVLFLAVALAVWALLRLAIAPWLAALSAVAIVGVDPLVENLRHNYADSLTALVASLGLLCLTLWLLHDSSTLLVLAGLFLASAALLKNEGLMFSFVAIAAAALTCPLARRSPRALLWVGGAVLVAVAPWQVFIRLNGLPSSRDLSFSSLADPSYAVEHWRRFGQASDALFDALAQGWALPVTAGLISLVAAAASRRYELVVLFVGWTTLGFAGLVLTYYVATGDVNWLIAASVDRVVATLALGMAVIAPVLASEAWHARRANVVPAAARVERPVTNAVSADS